MRIIMPSMMTTTTMTMKTTTMTSEHEARYRKAVRARSMTDPLGAMGFRTQSQRVRKEARIRRLFFGLTTVGFAGILGVIIATAPVQPQSTSDGALAAANQPAQTGRVNSSASKQNQDQPSHTRTRGS
jgi:hypothetical protein